MGALLIPDQPILLLPSLAKLIGLNEAIMLQQINYWLEKSNHEIEGRKWVYNTYKEWQEQMPFWSESTIKRTIKSLEDKGYLISKNFNRLKIDKTKWYSINREKLRTDGETLLNSSGGQGEARTDSEWDVEKGDMNKAIPEITTETTTENTTTSAIPFSAIVSYLNEKTNSSYKPGTKKTRELITARWKEGFTLEDFQRVIDLKTAEWLNDSYWSKYLRPETLFGRKFESYLNQKTLKNSYNEGDFDLDEHEDEEA